MKQCSVRSQQLVIIGILALLVGVGLSGCTSSLEQQFYNSCVLKIPSWCDYESFYDAYIRREEGKDFYQASIKYGIKENVYGREIWSDYDMLYAKGKLIDGKWELKVYKTDYTGQHTLEEFWSSWDT